MEKENSYFRPFTRDSLVRVQSKITEEQTRREELEKKHKDGRRGKRRRHYHDEHDENEDSRPDPKLEQGKRLPIWMAAAFESDYAGIPLEDFDPYYQKHIPTFVIVSKKKEIFRFSATNALYLLSPWNPVRRVAITILLHSFFTFVIVSTIVANCVVEIIPSSPLVESTEIFFTEFFTFQLAINAMARGFIMSPFTYLRGGWNRLEFLVVCLGYASVEFQTASLSALRVFQVVMALKEVIPGLNSIVVAVLESMKNLRDVIILTMFTVSLFALIGMQIYMGVLTQKCIKDFPEDGSVGEERMKNWHAWNSNITNWHPYPPPEEYGAADYPICGNASGAGSCPENYSCLQGYGPNPNYGFTSFDSFKWAMLSVFRIMTQDFWESLYQQVLRTSGSHHLLFFIVIIILGSFYILNLFLAIIALSYDEIQQQAEKDELAAAAEAEAMRLEKEGNTKRITKPEESESENGEGDFGDGETGRNSRGMMIRDGEDANSESLPLRTRVLSGFLKCAESFGVWDCGFPWSSFRQYVAVIVLDPFAELFFTICIAVNTILLASDHHGIKEKVLLASTLKIGNTVFSYIFATEAVMKVIAMSPKVYFQIGWNIFDFIIVALSLLELWLDDDAGLVGVIVLRSFRVLRVFKLARWWPTLNLLINIVGRTMVAHGNLVFVLIVIIFVFALEGKQLFAKDYYDNYHLLPGKEMPRWNFTDFWHSFMIVFRVLCGEWIESLWDCTKMAGFKCVPFFMATVVIGNFVVLNLFFALLLRSFGTVNSCSTEADAETNKLVKAFYRIGCLIQCVNYSVRRAVANFLRNCAKSKNQVSDGSEQVHEKCVASTSFNAIEIKNDSIYNQHEGLANSATNLREKMTQEDNNEHSQVKNDDRKSTKAQHSFERNLTSMTATETEVSEPVVGLGIVKTGSQDSSGLYRKFLIYYNDFKNTRFYLFFCRLRMVACRVTENEKFETATLVIILISCIALSLDDVHLPGNPILTDILYQMDATIRFVFFLEMLLRWLALGFRKYFSSVLCCLDFTVVMASLLNFLRTISGLREIIIFRTIQALRGFRFLRLLSRMEGTRVLLKAMGKAISSIFNALLVCLMVWLIFAIVGVQLFNGRFYKCIDWDDGTVQDFRKIRGKVDCLAQNFTWENSVMNFDHVGNAYLSLFQVATFKGWLVITSDAVDSRGEDEQPHREINFSMYAYFVVFVIFGSFFIRNLFTGVIVDSFNEQKKKAGGSPEMFMTEIQKKYYNALKNMGKRRSLKALPRLKEKTQAAVFAIIMNQKFEKLIMAFLVLNVFIMTLDSYQQSDEWNLMLNYCNGILTGIFTSEFLLKIFALRQNYFMDPWNCFASVLVILSISDLCLSELAPEYYFSSTLLQVIHVGKVGLALRLVKGAKGIRTLLLALAMSLPSLLNMCFVLFLVISIFAIFGMSLFMNVKLRGGLDDVYNFQTFGQSLILLFQMSTSAGWDGIFDCLINEEECTPPDSELGIAGDCGNFFLAAAFLLPYLFITFFFLIADNMYIAIVIENYAEATKKGQDGLTDDDYDMFYEIWAQFDPDVTHYIKYAQLSDFLDVLEPPLQILKPNGFKIVYMDIPICMDDKIYCVDIIDALARDLLARKGYFSEDAVELTESPMRKDVQDYSPISSTLKRQREEFCARTIQNFWKRFLIKKNKKPLEIYNSSPCF